MMFPEFELEPGEQLIRETRKHWFLFAVGLLPYAILAILPAALPNLLAFIPSTISTVRLAEVDPATMRVIVGVWLLLIWTAAWGSFTRYYLNAWILTNQRLVEITQKSYFHREVSSTLLNRVQDVTTEVHGMIPSFLGFGSIRVQSAGAVDEFMMNGVPQPEEMRDLVLKFASAEPQKTEV